MANKDKPYLNNLNQLISQKLKERLALLERKLFTLSDKEQWKSFNQAITADGSVNNIKKTLDINSDLLLIPDPNIGMFYQLEINNIDLMIIDHVSGSIGLVASINAPVNPESTTDSSINNSSKSIKTQIDTAIDTANYLRHLMLNHDLKFHVEVVLVLHENPEADAIQGAAPQKEQQKEETKQHETVAHLADIIQQTNYFHALGVNILHYTPHGDEQITDSNFDKCFSWLLLQYQHWIGQATSHFDGHSDSESNKKTGFKLKNYRSWINQSLELKTEHQVHLVHGNNGTGKSTLAEAMELLFTNRISRLASKSSATYPDKIRNYNTGQQDVHLEVSQAAPKPAIKYTLGEEGLWQDSNGKISEDLLHSVDNFRIDQQLMSKLTSPVEDERTEHFLNAFFPGEANLKQQIKQVTDKISGVLASDRITLNQETDEALNAANLIERLMVFGSPKWQVSKSEFEALFGITVNELKLIGRLDPTIQTIATQLESKKPKINNSFLKNLDKSFADLKDKLPKLEDALESSKVLLDKGPDGIAQWNLKVERTGTPTGELLNGWLDAWILTEINKQGLAAAKTLQEAAGNHWLLPQNNTYIDDLDYSDSQITLLTQELQINSARHEELHKQVNALGQEHKTNTAAQFKTNLSSADIATLNLVTPYLNLPSDINVPLGTVLQDLMQGNVSQNRASELKGTGFFQKTDWCDGLKETITDLLEAIREVTRSDMLTRVSRPFVNQLSNYRALLKDLHELDALNKRQATAFLHRLKDLNKPLNELLALSTSASWQYKPINFPDINDANEQTTSNYNSDYSDKKHSPMDILNTAELNLFSICLFFLCTPRLPNPAKLLLLDDPLQNMDELTVTTFARGLGRIFRLWATNDNFKHWQVLFLFHGEDDLTRFRQEVFAARYHLPRQSKQVTHEETIKITCEPGEQALDVKAHSFDIFRLLQNLENLD